MHIVNRFWSGSQVLLIHATVTSPATPADRDVHWGFGDLPMYVHNRSGSVALARNEIADWY